MIEIETVKGFQDFLPPESLKRAKVREIIEKWFKRYGFTPIETPVIEFDELMKPDNLPTEEEDEAVSDRFRLKDRGGRNLGLRYEFTFQLSRILKQNPNLKMPFKRYQIGEVFRDEPISGNRFRQFTQCDIDIVGDPSVNADAEVLALTLDVLKELKIPAEIQVNNRKLIKGIIESVEIANVKNVMIELDKIDKLGEDEVKNNLRKYADTNKILTLFKLFEKPLEFFKQNAFDGAEELEDLLDRCSDYGIKPKINLFMVRGLGYYTGNIFEVKVTGKKETIAGGGRYDKSVGKFLGRDLPAVGISFGLERVSSLSQIKVRKQTTALLISISQDKASASLAKKLRKENISCMLSFERPGKSLEYANSLEIPYVVFIGEEEIGKKKFKIRDMKSGSENLLTEKQLISFLSKK
ncbi:MAG: histidine--tRNA ligase [Nanoarchaeota archaeon]